MPSATTSPEHRRRPRVLVVDPHDDDRALAFALLRDRVPGVAVTEVADAVAFAEALAEGAFDAVVTELHLVWSDGLAVLRAVKRRYPRRPVVLWTAEIDPDLASRAVRSGVDGLVPKTSRGYLHLPAVVLEVLERPARSAVPGTPGEPDSPAPPATGTSSPTGADVDLFAHAVSHDLQEPLQHVVRAARRVGERLAGRLEADDERQLHHLVESAERMQTMVDSLLEVSRITTRGRPFEAVDLEGVVDEVLATLEETLDAAGAAVERTALPTVPADRSQMVQLFQNLIGNALKFRGDEAPRIRISASEEDGRWVLGLADNGIGIDPADQERIFQMFQRLHPASRYPGTGIGLALCKRIVERHGGELRVTSRSGEGATFTVALPREADRPLAAPATPRLRRVDSGGT